MRAASYELLELFEADPAARIDLEDTLENDIESRRNGQDRLEKAEIPYVGSEA
jgi:hypothetical protein